MPTLQLPPAFTVADVRKSFLDFFASKGHTVVPSSPLVPGNDPTLMFVNSGMVQFKDVFLGTDKRSYVRAASVQACLRAGGKHNDLENVGYTARHHTFFEMLGNWSFGDYFKRDSLKWGWELLTQVYKLPADRLTATVYIDDQEAYDIWTKEIGLPPERVIRIGDNKGKKYASDNFWMMADTGPCGPCSEIFYDHGDHIPGGPPGSPGEDGDRFIEIWNHVFMQFDMQADGSLIKLPAPCVDTGMGLERLAAILQHVHSNYEIDIFDALIKAASRETGCADLNNKSLRVIADHIRATAFLVADGVIPSSDGRGYVQRRIIRRAIRHGYKLGKKTPFFHKLVADLVVQMGDAYPKLKSDEKRIIEVLRAEEERFFETLATGMDILDHEFYKLTATSELEVEKQKNRELSSNRVKFSLLGGDVAFKLHDTYGFPLDLTQDVCRERGVAVDDVGFSAAMDKQKSQARAAGKFKMDKALDYTGTSNEFVGYDKLTFTAKIIAIYVDGTLATELKEGKNGIIVLETTPFYAEAGGQVGDEGWLLGGDPSPQPSPQRGEGVMHRSEAVMPGHEGVMPKGERPIADGGGATQAGHSVLPPLPLAGEGGGERVLFEVIDTQKIKADVYGHHGTLKTGSLKVGDEVTAQVNTERRAASMRNHSVTHIMHKALREVLGDHVQQKGSLVNAEQTRFDFAHNGPVTDAEIKEIEKRVNAEILTNSATQARVMDIESAQKTGATMLFGEKYGETVRVLDIGSSRELCGGTHVQRTGDIGLFKITSEGGVASGVRRIEAITGSNALRYLQKLEDSVGQAAGALKAPVVELNERIHHMLDHVKSLEKEVAALKGKLASSQGDELVTQAVDLIAKDGKTIKLLVAKLEGADAKTLRDTMDKLKDKLKTAVIVLGVAEGPKVQIAVGVTADSIDKVKAGELVNFVAAQVGGKGGGKADMAMAGGTEPAKLAAALASVQAWVSAKI